LTSDYEPKRFAVNLDSLDFAKIKRVGDKVMQMLNKKVSNPVEAYFLLKLLCFSIEASEGFKLMPEDEERLRELCFKPSRAGSKNTP
jgi:hypothetical protein